MKKILLLAILAAMGWSIKAQNAIPNGNFETWTTSSYDDLQNYQTSNVEAFFNCNASANCVKTAQSYQGSWAVQITTVGTGNNACFGYFIIGKPENDPSTWHGGIPYNQKPTGLQGYYKSDIPTGDSAIVLANFSLAGHSIGLYAFKLYGQHSSYTPFSFSFNPPLPYTPDSVMFGATSSDVLSQNITAINGSMIQIDHVSFTGVASQPAMLNGDFELWTPIILYKPAQWYMNNGGGSSSVTQTTDKHSGNDAVEMKTTVGNDKSGPVASAGSISTGYYERNCNNNCSPLGGFPLANQIDTLGFWYKYAPMGGDTAVVSLNFKKNGVAMYYTEKKLNSAASYQYVELPFNTWQVPDTVIVQFQSSLWQHTSLGYVGSVLKVDEAGFKSQKVTTGILNHRMDEKITIFPNPGNGIFSIQSDVKISLIEVKNMLGENIYSVQPIDNDAVIDLSNQPKGVYFYQFKRGLEIIKEGKLIIK